MESTSDPLILPDNNDVVHGCGATLPCDPRRRLHRYLMIFFICFLSFGSYFCYDTPAAMQDLMLRDLGLTEIQFMNLYAWYSWPTVILCFVSGFLVDRVFGVALGGIIFAICVLFGQILFGVGALLNSLGLIYFARFIFGIGGESLCLTQNTYVGQWFSSTELNFVFGLQLSMARIGSTVSMTTMHPLYRWIGEKMNITGYQRLGAALLMAAVTCVFSTICAFFLGYFTIRAQRILKAHADKTVVVEPNAADTNTTESSSAVQTIRLKDIPQFPAAIWFICGVCVTYYVTVFPFISLGLVFFEHKFHLSVTDATVVNSILFILSAVASPILGAAVDFCGRNLLWILSSIVLTLFCHMCFAFTIGTLPPVFLMVVMGVAYSIMASSLWPLVSLLLPVHQQGTAYGLIQSVQNLGLGVVSILAGYLVDNKGYLFLEVFFTFCLSITFALTLMLYVWDQTHANVLNQSGASRRAKLRNVVPVCADETTNVSNTQDA